MLTSEMTDLLQIWSIFLQLQAIKYSGPAFLSYPVECKPLLRLTLASSAG